MDGKIEAEDLEIKNIAADFVFDKSYHLLSFEDLQEFINKNNHLPDIPPATVTKKGISIGDFNQDLLQKIEELTLYVLKLNEQNKLLRSEINELKRTK
ncbi:MAG: hypothetical protein ACOC3T_06130 [Bacteroidota bacterium]